MSEYVSPEYQDRLLKLAEMLVTPARYAVAATLEVVPPVEQIVA